MAYWGPGNLADGFEGGNHALERMRVVDCTVDLGKDTALRSRFAGLVVADCH